MPVLLVIIFTFAAILGITLITYVMRNKNTPKSVALIHGSLGLVGIILLFVYICIYQTRPYLSLSLFILAAIGGVILMYRDVTHKSIPKWFALGHGFIAVVAFILLLIALFV